MYIETKRDFSQFYIHHTLLTRLRIKIYYYAEYIPIGFLVKFRQNIGYALITDILSYYVRERKKEPTKVLPLFQLITVISYILPIVFR